jgi:sigma-B regulation protein RsbU (phosphoserine phosphatase)
MRALNDSLIERKVEARYVTLFVALWDPATRLFVMANAGAMPPMVCRGGDIVKLRVEGVPLGLLEARDYDEVTFQAEPRDVLLLYSDGITDHMNSSGQEFGRGRIAQALRQNCHLAAAEIVTELFAEMDRFSTTAFDDQTLFALKVK